MLDEQILEIREIRQQVSEKCSHGARSGCAVEERLRRSGQLHFQNSLGEKPLAEVPHP
jgi:hypothetical protein